MQLQANNGQTALDVAMRVAVESWEAPAVKKRAAADLLKQVGALKKLELQGRADTDEENAATTSHASRLHRSTGQSRIHTHGTLKVEI